MKKLSLIILLAIGFTAKSQDYYHGAGVGIMFGMFNQEYTTPYSSVSSSAGAYVPGIMYKGTLSFEMSRSSSLGITASPFLGFFFSSGGGSYLGYQLPVMAEYVLGDLDDRCFYFGGGFSYGFVSDGDTGGAVMGPVLGLGGQLELKDNLIGVRGGYTIGVNKEKDVPSGTEYQRDNRSAVVLSVYYVF